MDHSDDLTHDMVFERLLADMRAKGVKVAEPSDPFHDTDFIRALIATYTIAPTTDWIEPPAARTAPPQERRAQGRGCQHRQRRYLGQRSGTRSRVLSRWTRLDVIATVQTPEVLEVIVGRRGTGSQLMLAHGRQTGPVTPSGIWKVYLSTDDLAGDNAKPSPRGRPSSPNRPTSSSST